MIKYRLIGILVLLSLTLISCVQPPAPPTTPTVTQGNGGSTVPDIQPEGNIVSLTFSFGGGMVNDFRSFTLRLQDDDVWLDAQYNHFSHASGTLQRIDATNIPASADDLQALNDLCEVYGLVTRKTSIEGVAGVVSPPPISALMELRDGDKRADSLVILWENGARKTLKTGDSYFSMDAFFSSLANRISTPPAEGEIIAMRVNPRVGKGFYEVRDYAGKCEMRYISPEQETTSAFTIPLTQDNINELRSLCAEVNLTEMQQLFRPFIPCYEHDYEESGFNFEVEWENGARLVATTAFGIEEQLWRLVRSFSGVVE